MKKKLPYLLALVCLVLAACSSTTPQPGSEPTITLEDCTLTADGISAQTRAKCGTLSVWENRETQSGTKIDLRIAVIPADSQNAEPDPIFLLAGGPGQAAVEAFLPVLPALNSMNFKRDIVLVDQRGTGGSNPLTCEAAGDSEMSIIGEEPDDTEVLAEIDACMKQLSSDPTQYTTPAFIEDLEEVRVGLGYEQINLFGVSYGTRSALEYMRRHPASIRSVILNAVVPPDWAIGDRLGPDAQRSLDILFERCENEPACQEAFPNLKTAFEDWLAELDEQPLDTLVPDPVTGEDVRVIATRELVAGTIRYMSYSEDLTALLPLLMYQAAVEDNPAPLLAQYLIILQPSSADLSSGLFYSVICAEDAPYFSHDDDDDQAYFPSQEGDFEMICSHWEHADPDPAMREPVVSDIPTLILTGGADPVTPPQNGDAVAQNLSNNLHLVIPGMGHNLLYQGCLPRVLADFVESASVEGLDVACTERIHPQPFFTSPAGPQP